MIKNIHTSQVTDTCLKQERVCIYRQHLISLHISVVLQYHSELRYFLNILP